MSDISTCEKDPDGSYYANVVIPIWLARTGIKCVMFSTDQVYSGCAGDGPYTEEDTAPSNLYSRHKLEMEQRTLDIQPETILLRATWMYDMPKYGVMNRGNFLINMLRQSEISFSFAQHRAVTYVREVAGLIRQAALLPGGAYNYGSENDLTMFETAEWLRQTLSLPIKMQDTGPRHNLWMDCSKIRNQGIHFSDTVEGLQKCIRDYSL
jgi:dTDP-4-dehydrorhamnose reductase